MATPRSSLTSAVLLMLAAVLLFALMDAGLKLLSSQYPPLQVAALRGLSSLPLVTLWVLATVPAHSLLRVHWPLHLLRGALVTAMAGPLLKERVGAGRWIAIVIGLVGVLVILRPTGEGMLTGGGLAILIAAICYALGAVTVRMLAQRDSTQAMVFWFVVLLSLGAWLLALPAWKPLQPAHGWIIAGVGISGSLAQVALTEAFRRGEASLIAPLEYTALVWGVLLDVALWSVLPDGVTWIGAGIIVASGLYLLRREKVHVEAEHP